MCRAGAFRLLGRVPRASAFFVLFMRRHKAQSRHSRGTARSDPKKAAARSDLIKLLAGASAPHLVSDLGEQSAQLRVNQPQFVVVISRVPRTRATPARQRAQGHVTEG